MKRRSRRVHHRRSSAVRARQASQPQYLVLVRGWMFLVMFALMLGLGAVVGTAVSKNFNQDKPEVAGVQIEKPLK
ncbi:hypothetical protein HY086_03640 [Candidatus Gottesmanbacteria bacterium]|nr:hypothetical protein [Candidatus Gottesmanbacteria bacterium]